MKTRISSGLLLAAALSVSALNPLSAAPTAPRIGATAYPVRSVFQNNCTIMRGVTAATVRRTLGAPHEELSGDTWIYRGYHADFEPANAQQCDTLILTVARGEVTEIKLVNQRAATLIAARVKAKTPDLIADAK